MLLENVIPTAVRLLAAHPKIIKQHMCRNTIDVRITVIPQSPIKADAVISTFLTATDVLGS
jgi:hypothetical protein